MTRLPGPRGPFAVLSLARHLNADPYATLPAMLDEYGPVIEFGRGKYKYIYLLSPEANEHILVGDPGNFTWKEAFQPLVAVNGETALVVSDGDEHQRRRRIVQPAFHIRRIASYFDVMLDETNQVIDTWNTGDTVDAYAEFRITIRRIVLRCLFGQGLRNVDAQIGDQLEVALAYVNRPPMRRLDWNLPWSAYRSAITARTAVDAIVFAEINRRREHDEQSDDILGWLMAGQDDDRLNDQEVRDQVVSLVAAGYDTTASAMGWIAANLADESVHRDIIRAEVDTVGGIEHFNLEKLSKLTYTAAFVNEVLRVHPPAIWSGRTVVDDFNIHGCTIPAGEKVLFSPHVTHHLPSEFPEPSAVKPGRWIDGHPDQHDSHPYAFIPFGGGPRRCLGFAFATQELIAMTAVHASRVDSSRAVGQPLVPAGTMSSAPAGGVPVTIGTVRSL